MEIEFNDVSFSYNCKSSSKNTLSDINLKIKEGITLITGPSGSGKTTLIQMINVLLKPSSGFLNVGDYYIDKKNDIPNIDLLRRKIGFVFQFSGEQIFERTVLKEINFALKFLNVNKKEEEIISILENLGLDSSYLNKNPFLLSDGEKKIISLASILIMDPEILILDEPMVGLDYSVIKNVFNIIREYKRNNKKVIVVSHDVDYWYDKVDNVIGLNNGKVIINDIKQKAFVDIPYLEKNNICIPKVALFLYILKETKKVDLGFYDNIHDLMKAVYRYGR